MEGKGVWKRGGLVAFDVHRWKSNGDQIWEDPRPRPAERRWRKKRGFPMHVEIDIYCLT